MDASKPLRILVTDGDSRSALAVTRSLGRGGHAVITAGNRQRTLAGASRFCSDCFAYPDPVLHSSAFLRAIADAVRLRSIDVLMPMTEVTTLLLTRHRDELPPGCKLPFANAEAIDRASDKAGIVELARTLGVPVPASVLASTALQAHALVPQLAYPVVIKPARSRILTRNGWISTHVAHARDAAAFTAAIGTIPPEAFPVLLQERISGAGVGVFACYDQGRPVAYFAHRRLREKPPSGGVSVLRESIAIDPLAREYAHRLLERLGWHGVAMVEFKRDDRDHSLRLMEINGRFWGSLQLAIDAGVDFPALLVDVARGTSVAPAESYRTGVRSRWFLGDLDVLLTVWLHRRSSLNLPAGFPTRLGLLREFIRFRDPDLRYEVLTCEDPDPGFREIRRWLSGG